MLETKNITIDESKCNKKIFLLTGSQPVKAPAAKKKHSLAPQTCGAEALEASRRKAREGGTTGRACEHP